MEQFLSAKFLSGRNANQKIGILDSTEEQKVLEVIGNVGIGTTIFDPTQKLDVRGSVSVADTITATTIDATIINATTIDATNATIDNLTFTSGTAITSVDTDLTTVSASDDTLASAKAIKDYVDNEVSTIITGNVTLDFAGDTGTGNIGLDSETFTIAGTTNEIETVGAGNTLTIGLPNVVAITTSLTVGSATTINSSGINAPTGIITATSFVGNLIGNTPGLTNGVASTATQLETARDFSITGSFVTASAVSFDGTANVALGATITPDSITLGTYTSGDYVESITGTANEIEVTGGTGEGSTPQIGLPNDVTITQDLTVNRDVQINRNLNVDGNITIGGTTATLFTQTLTVADSDLILGVRTDAFGNDVSNDTTANHGGIAIASTEGNPLITIVNPGAGETLPATYKKIMWFKSGSFAGLGTDAWLINYGVGIGSTQVPNGVRLAAGNVQFTENDLSVVRNINASGIATLPTIDAANATIDNLTFTSGTAITSVDTDLTTVSASDDTLASAKAIKDYVDNEVSTAVGNVTLDFAGDTGTGIIDVGSETFTIAGTVNEIETVGTGNTLTIGLSGSVAITTSLVVGSAVTITSSGIDASSGIITALQFVGTASTASFATTAFTLNGTSEAELSVGSAVTATNLAGGDAGDIPYQSAANTTTFVDASLASTGQVLIWNGSTPSWGNVSAAAGAFGGIGVQDESTPVGTAGSVATLNFVGSNIQATATTGANGISTITLSDTPTFDTLSVTGIATLGTVEVNSGIITATSGIVTYYGDGQYLQNIISGVSISTETTNQSQFIPYAISTGTTTGFGVTTTSLVFNPSTTRLGIGTTNPQANLHVVDEFLVAAGSATTQHITQRAYELENGSLSWEGTAGQLFSITNNLTSGSIFSVNDVSGIPSIDVDADGTIQLAPYADGNVGIATTLPTSRLHVVGDVLVTGVVTATSFSGNATSATYATSSGISTSVIGGIASVTSLSVSGISTLGTVQISSGIVTATSGIITYYGDGSQLDGIQGGSSISTVTSNQAQYIPYATSFGSTTGLGATTLLVYNPSTSSLGIGTTNPQTNLYVVGDGFFTGIVTATDFNSTSDAKLKTNVQVIEDPLEKVLQINGVSFNWIKDNKPSMGVIADNIQEVLPELVSDTDPKTVNYNGLIGLLIECVKQQQVEIEELKRKVG